MDEIQLGPRLRFFRPSLPGICIFLLCLLSASGCALQRHHEAVLVLGDIAAGAAPSDLKERTPQPSRTPIAYTIDGRAHIGDLYLPGEGKPEAGIVLVPGMVQEGKDAPNFVTFATTLARARFAVVAPQLSGLRDLRIEPGQAREVADAFRYLADREDLSPDGRAGIAGISYALGPVMVAALEDDIRERVRFIFGVGGYYDLRSALRFVTTGYFEVDGSPRSVKSSQYGKLVFAKSVLHDLHDPKDRAIFEEMVEVKLKDFNADISPLAEGLGPEGMSVHRLLTNTDPRLTPQLIAALPAATVATIDALTLSDKDLTRLRARLLLGAWQERRADPLHGKRGAGQCRRTVPGARIRLERGAGTRGSHAFEFFVHAVLDQRAARRVAPVPRRQFAAQGTRTAAEKQAREVIDSNVRGSKVPVVFDRIEQAGYDGAKPARARQEFRSLQNRPKRADPRKLVRPRCLRRLATQTEHANRRPTQN